MSDPLISSCTIVKNEREYLPGMFECFAPLVDEFIVVDTGSTDGTLDITHPKLRLFPSQYFTKDTHPYEFDFSKARNEARDHAIGEWCLNIDPEYRMAREKVLELRKIIEGDEAKNLDVIAILISSGLERVYQASLIRRSCPIRYFGCVHETMKVRGLRVQAYPNIVIEHLRPVTDEDPEIGRAKRERYLMMAVNALLRNPDDEHALGIIAQQFRNCNMLKEAKAACLHVLNYKEGREYDADYVSNMMMILAECYAWEGQCEMAIQQFKGVLIYRPAAAEAMWAIGEIYRTIGDFDNAEIWYTKALENKPPGKAFQLDRPMYRTTKPLESLRLLAEQRAKKQLTTPKEVVCTASL